MKLAEALQVLRQPPPLQAAAPFRVFLACGFTPLHLETFLGARLKVHSPRHQVAVQTGHYGDCLGNLERLPGVEAEAAAVVLEWSDFDPRLGLRRLGGWGPRELPDILATFKERANRFEEALTKAGNAVPLAVCLPTLPVPPVAFVPGWRDGHFNLRLREEVAAFAARVGLNPRIRFVSPQRLDRLSPPAARLDVRSELSAGFPYRLAHADALAELLVPLLRPPQPRKGLITDLDDTLWSGVVGDVGVEGLSWDLDHRSHTHALYQQMLNSLAEAGVLVAVASKNDAQVVEQALGRGDLIVSRDRFFPLEAHWGAKSESVARILRAWNIDADSVVFVDDTPMELAEVRAAFPSMECLLFPRQDDQAVYDLLERLRDLFGKDAISEEDALRQASLRATAIRAEGRSSGPPAEGFLQAMDAELSFVIQKVPPDVRAFELVNKTNQFNLNGRRYAEGSWLSYLNRPETVLLTASYKDKYGPLGKVAVLAGRIQDKKFFLDAWVLSCRAFARRVEHRCLEILFNHLGLEEVVFDFEATPRNLPLQEFLKGLLDVPPAPGVCLSQAQFARRCPALSHRVKVLANG